MLAIDGTDVKPKMQSPIKKLFLQSLNKYRLVQSNRNDDTVKDSMSERTN